MDKKLNEQLDKYSKNIIEFDLSNIEHDVKLRITSEQNSYQKLIKIIEKLFGMPITLSGGILASTLALGILLGTGLTSNQLSDQYYRLDLEVFSPNNSQLPSSLLGSIE